MATLGELTFDKAVKALRNFFRNTPFVFMGTGMSCALDVRFGMPHLTVALQSGMDGKRLTVEQAREWTSVISALHNGYDLENALNLVNDQVLLKMLTDITGYFIASVDRHYSYEIANGSVEWPAIVFIKKLVDTLSENDPVLHVLTPNYDMLLEYSCEHHGVVYSNGLFGGVEKRTNWPAIQHALSTHERVVHSGKSKVVHKVQRHIRLYKVHGSLNYFYHRSAVIENNAWMWTPPEYAERVMITPGMSKYQTLQRYRQELLQTADSAISKANCFLFIGYGFNDSHLEEYINRKLITHSCNGLIITRDSNSRIDSLLNNSDNLWLICKNSDAAVCNSSIVRNKLYDTQLVLDNSNLWDIREFTEKILGG